MPADVEAAAEQGGRDVAFAGAGVGHGGETLPAAVGTVFRELRDAVPAQGRVVASGGLVDAGLARRGREAGGRMRDTEEVRRGVDDEEEVCHPCLQRSSGGPALAAFFHAEDSSTTPIPQVNFLRKARLKNERFPNERSTLCG